MTGRWALFVDAGWLFAAGSTLAMGHPLERKLLSWSTAEFIEALVDRASGLPGPEAELLRTYWYDGSPNRLPIGQQNEVAEQHDVKLRLGRTARDGQKGVDGLIIHDLITLAYRKDISDAVVVSGDEDLLDAIESAQANGTRVHLLEIPIGGIAPALMRSFDRRERLDEAFFRTHLHHIEEPPASEPVAASDIDDVEADASPTILAPNGEQTPRPTWMDQPLRPSPLGELAADDLEFASTAATEFALAWLLEADEDTYSELLSSRPYLGRELDAQLLRSAGRWLTEAERRTLRDSFWSTLANNLPGNGHPPVAGDSSSWLDNRSTRLDADNRS